MYRVFSDGLYTVHQDNFALYCKPHLQNLPPNTAVELQNARKKLQDDELPLYRPIQFDTLPEPTVPTFETTLEKANVPPPTLLPRAQWMTDTPPFLSDTDADAAYNAACAWTFGTGDPSAFMNKNTSTSTPESLFLAKTKYPSLHPPRTTKSPSLPLPQTAGITTQRSFVNPLYFPRTYSGDIRNPTHTYHAAFQELRRKITSHLNDQDQIQDFNQRYIPTTASCPATVTRLTALLAQWNAIEKVLEDLIDSWQTVPPNSTVEEETNLEAQINDFNRLLFCEYVVFLSSSISETTTTQDNIPSDHLTLARYENAMLDTSRNRAAVLKFNAALDAMTATTADLSRRRNFSIAIQHRIQHMGSSCNLPPAATIMPHLRQSSRPRPAKRVR
jgi:hypothetical protein